MNGKQLSRLVWIAIFAHQTPQSVAIGHATCPCQLQPDIAEPSVPAPVVQQQGRIVLSRLPASWPRQWGNPGNISGEAPIVPEPGSIVLFRIAMGVGGASYFHRRRAISPTPASP